MSGPASRCSRGCASSVPEWSWDCAGASGWVLRRLTEFNAGRACHDMPLWGSSARDDHCRASGLGARCRPVRTVRPYQPARSSTDCNGHGASQGGAPSRPGECRARPIARAGRLVSTVTAVPAHSRPEDGATAARLAARRRHKPTLDQAQTSGSRWPVSSEGGWLMMVIVGTGPPAAHTSVGLITNAHTAPQSELTVTC